MKTITPLSKTYKELGIAFTFPINITNEKGSRTYHETSDGFCYRKEYDKNGNETYTENSNGIWSRREYGESGKITYFENSNGNWYRSEYDENGKRTYHESSFGYTWGAKRSSCEDKVIEVDGKKYKLTEL